MTLAEPLEEAACELATDVKAIAPMSPNNGFFITLLVFTTLILPCFARFTKEDAKAPFAYDMMHGIRICSRRDQAVYPNSLEGHSRLPLNLKAASIKVSRFP